jgi:NitT/TauT family transport system substrate-binding protein
VVWPGFECLYLARDLGYYKDTSIRLVEYNATSEITRAFRNRELEAIAYTVPEALSLVAAEPTLQAVLVTDISNGGDVIVAKPRIQDLPALKGRRVGMESSSGLGAYMITRALEQVKLSPKDVRIIPLEVSEHEQEFKKGTVDAVITYEPARSTLLAAGGKLLFDSSKIPNEIADILFVRGDLLTSQSANLQALIKGWFRALAYLKSNPQDAAHRIAPREGISPEQFLESLKGIHIPNIEENQKLLGKTDTSLLNAIKRLSKVMVENNLLEQAVEPTRLLNDELVKSVQ